MAHDWTARLRNPNMPGGYTCGGVSAPVGTVELTMIVQDAGPTHTGRDIRATIAPEDLDAIKSLIDGAISVRDAAAVIAYGTGQCTSIDARTGQRCCRRLHATSDGRRTHKNTPYNTGATYREWK